MRIKAINILFLCVAGLFVFTLSGCNNTTKKVSTDKTFEKTIDGKLYNITHPKASQVSSSSNPYDYINCAEGNKDYKYIVAQGGKSLYYMLKKFANSDKNGLEEYIMAIACSEILTEDPDTKNWDTGRAWYDNYIKSIKSHKYLKNKYGETYGIGSDAIYNGDKEPDLIRAAGTDGKTIGYVRSSDLNGFQPKNPEEALEYMTKHKEDRIIPLYDSNGKKVIGKFRISSPNN